MDKVRLLTIGTNRAKGIIYDRCTIEEGNGYVEFSDKMPDEWFQQLLSEDSYPFWKNGARYRQFVKPANARNEGLDCAVYALASFVALGAVNYDYEEKQLSDGQEQKPKEAKKPQRGFVGVQGWKV